MFELNMNADPSGNSLRATFKVSYKALKSKFGPGDKVSGDKKVHVQWLFDAKPINQVVTLYEWKEIGPLGGGLKRFKNKASYEWHIGAKSRMIAQLFAGWLLTQLKQGSYKE